MGHISLAMRENHNRNHWKFLMNYMVREAKVCTNHGLWGQDYAKY